MTPDSPPPTLVGPHFDRLHAANVVLRARARRHAAAVAAGPFSVKSVIEGEVGWEVEGRRFRVTPGVHLLLDRGEPYRLDIDEREPVETFVVFFADDFVAGVAAARREPIDRLLDQPQATAWLPITQRLWEGPTRLSAGLRLLRALAGESPEPGELDVVLRGLLDGCADLAAETRREQDRLAASRPSTRVEVHRRLLRGKAFLDEHFDRGFDLAGAAREACLSLHHFHRSFRAVFGAPPYAYVARRRIRQAERLLRETDRPIVEVSTEVGYESLPSFTRRFRRETGRSPAVWRRQFRQEG